MIKNITTGQGIMITSTAETPYINISMNMSTPSAGMIRFNGSHMEVYTGISWLQISNSIEISLDCETTTLLDWARKKMAEETAIEKLKDNPAIADLLKQRADIDEKLKIVEILIRDHNETI